MIARVHNAIPLQTSVDTVLEQGESASISRVIVVELAWTMARISPGKIRSAFHATRGEGRRETNHT